MAMAMVPADAASVAIFDGDRVLLIQRARAPYRLLWTLPGGRAEPGEMPEACAMREIAEELALTIADLHPVMVQTLESSGASWRLAVFATRRFAGALVPSDEIADHRWMQRDEVAALRTTAGLHHVLEKAFAACGQS